MKKSVWLLLFSLSLFVLIAGCGAKSNTNVSAPSGTPAGSPAAGAASTAPSGGTLKIGFVGGLSGPTASWGKPSYDATQYAVDEINSKGGINGMKMELVAEDDAGDPFKGTQIIDKFDNQKIKFVVSVSGSSGALAQREKIIQNKMLAISSVASDPAIPQEGTNFFTNINNSNVQGKAIATYASDELKVQEVIAFVRDDAYGKSILNGFKNANTTAKIVKEYSYPVDAQDFNSFLNQGIKAFPNANILLTGYAQDSGLIAKQARAIGYSKPFLGSHPISVPDYFKVAGDASNNTYFSLTFYRDKEKESQLSKDFFTGFQKKYNVEPDSYRALAYETIYLFKYAIEIAKAADVESVKKVLLSSKFEGVTSNSITFDTKGSLVKPINVGQWKGGSTVIIK